MALLRTHWYGTICAQWAPSSLRGVLNHDLLTALFAMDPMSYLFAYRAGDSKVRYRPRPPPRPEPSRAAPSRRTSLPSRRTSLPSASLPLPPPPAAPDPHSRPRPRPHPHPNPNPLTPSLPPVQLRVLPTPLNAKAAAKPSSPRQDGGAWPDDETPRVPRAANDISLGYSLPGAVVRDPSRAAQVLPPGVAREDLVTLLRRPGRDAARDEREKMHLH